MKLSSAKVTALTKRSCPAGRAPELPAGVLPVASQSRTVPSLPAEARRSPPGENATDRKDPS